MGCSKCGKGMDQAYLVGAIVDSNPVLDDNQMFSLSSAPGCTERYHGQFQGATVYIVGRDTPQEQLYLKAQYNQAQRDARSAGLTLDHVLAINLCHDTVVELLKA